MSWSSVHSKHQLGQLIFYEEPYEHRWVDAIGPNVVKFLDDFAVSLMESAWQCTLTEAGTGESLILPYDSEGGIAFFSYADADNDGIQIQSSNEGFKFTANDPCYFGARWAAIGVTAAGSQEIFIGLSNLDTTLVTGGSSCMGFNVTDGSNQIGFYGSKADSGTTQNILSTLTVGVFHTTEFYWDGTSKVLCWLDGVAKTSHTTQIPTAQTMAISIGAKTCGAVGGATNACGLAVDWVRAIQLLASR